MLRFSPGGRCSIDRFLCSVGTPMAVAAGTAVFLYVEAAAGSLLAEKDEALASAGAQPPCLFLVARRHVLRCVHDPRMCCSPLDLGYVSGPLVVDGWAHHPRPLSPSGAINAPAPLTNTPSDPVNAPFPPKTTPSSAQTAHLPIRSTRLPTKQRTFRFIGAPSHPSMRLLAESTHLAHLDNRAYFPAIHGEASCGISRPVALIVLFRVVLSSLRVTQRLVASRGGTAGMRSTATFSEPLTSEGLGSVFPEDLPESKRWKKIETCNASTSRSQSGGRNAADNSPSWSPTCLVSGTFATIQAITSPYRTRHYPRTPSFVEAQVLIFGAEMNRAASSPWCTGFSPGTSDVITLLYPDLYDPRFLMLMCILEVIMWWGVLHRLLAERCLPSTPPLATFWLLGARIQEPCG